VFTAAGRREGAMEKAITGAIKTGVGFSVSVLVRAATELAAVAEANPFVTKGIDPKELHAAFLSGAAPAAPLAGLDRPSFAPDEFEAGDRVLYLRQPDGVLATRLPDWERLLGLRVTARNWNTVTKLVAAAG
ncbi:MAG: DUF1697 domain-containing protein, partial [Acidimicrobiales bacterium]